MRRIAGIGALVLALSLLAPPAWAAGLAYEPRIAGVDDALREMLAEVSTLHQLRERPPASLAGLERRAERDRESLLETLRARGYYAARIAIEIDRDAAPLDVTIAVETGPLFLVGDVDIRFIDAPPEAHALRFDPFALGLEPGAPATAERIRAAEKALLVILSERGFPFAATAPRTVVVDHALYALAATLEVRTGPFARFGDVHIEGLESVSRDYVNRRIAWTDNAPYDSARVEETRRALMASRLFRSVRITPSAAPDSSGRVPIAINLVESEARAIGAGAGYSTDEGVGGRVFWEHRNLLHAGERLKTTVAGTEIRRRASVDFAKPDFFSRKNSLIAGILVRDENLEAFDSRALEGSVGLERQLLPSLVGTLSLGLERSLNEDDGSVEGFTLASLPLTLARDTTDDPLDPTQGGRSTLTLIPYGGDVSFVLARLRDSFYRSLTAEGGIIAAFWGSLGTIFGETRDSIPLDKRFYSGGGGSVRGYGFQLIGPLDDSNDPLGGRSIAEVGAELRFRLFDDVGFVPFIEGGNVFDDTTPDLGSDFFWASGFGLRYFTDFGPLRFDLAFPLDRRNAVDDAFQIYVSIGQAF